MSNASHNHRRKLIQQCRREVFKQRRLERKETRKKQTPMTLQEFMVLRKKGYELFRDKVAAIVKAKEGPPLMTAEQAILSIREVALSRPGMLIV